MSLRNSVITLLCIVAFLVTPLQSHAETVGVIVTRGVLFYEKLHNSLLSRLSTEGYIGKAHVTDRIKFIVQRPYPDHIAWSNASRKLIAADVDAIVAYGAPATLSVIRERPDIPVIYAGVYEPIALDIKAKNVTGICSKFRVSSLLRYLRAITTLKNVGVIYSNMEEDSKRQFLEIKKLSGKYGFSVTGLNLRRPGDIAGMLANVKLSALVITSSPTTSSVFPTILRIAEGKKIPTASLLQYEGLYATIGLSSDPEEEGRMAAEMLIEIFNGVHPKAIPAACSKNIELVFNLRDARKMGIRISMDLVTEATRIIY